MNGRIEGMRMGHSGELLAVYLAIGPAVTDEELAKTSLLMFKRYDLRISRDMDDQERRV